MKLLSGVLIAAVNSQQVCNDLGTDSVRCDPSCSGGGLGCNAGGQGELCRFCDFDPYRKGIHRHSKNQLRRKNINRM